MDQGPQFSKQFQFDSIYLPLYGNLQSSVLMPAGVLEVDQSSEGTHSEWELGMWG